MTFPMLCRHVVVFGAVVVFATPRVAYSQVPNAKDIAACNVEAQRAVRDGTGSQGSPVATAKDHTRAAAARGTEPVPQNGGGAKSEDPQLVGIDSEGAKDAAYQAVYRTCMRKSGF